MLLPTIIDISVCVYDYDESLNVCVYNESLNVCACNESFASTKYFLSVGEQKMELKSVNFRIIQQSEQQITEFLSSPVHSLGRRRNNKNYHRIFLQLNNLLLEISKTLTNGSVPFKMTQL